MKLSFGFLAISLASAVYGDKHKISGVIVKFPEFENGKVYLNLERNGLAEANDFYESKKYNQDEKPSVYFSKKTVKYIDSDNSYILEFQNKLVRGGYIIHGLPIPNKEKLKELSLILPHFFPETVIPMRIKLISPTRTEDDKKLEAKYAAKSIELMRKESDISDPLMIWACIFIIEYTYGVTNDKSTFQVLDIAEMTVKKIKLYQLDINKNLIKFKCGYTEDDLEFRRRIWWVYYFQITGNYIFNGKFIKFEQKDIVVNLPKNDFKWRYGGSFEVCGDKELQLLNNIANDPSDENNPTDCHRLIINTFSLHKNIATFVTKRWRKDHFDEDGTNMRFVLYINKLLKLRDKIDETLGDGFPAIKDKYLEYKGTAKLLIETENHIINHNLRHIYYSMIIYLYQSELVRDPDIKVIPERVKSAKQQCVYASIKQMELLEWYSKNVPNEYQGFPNVFWSLNSLLSLTNFFFIQDPSIKEKHTDYFNRIVSVYKTFYKNLDIVSTFLAFVNYIISIKTKASENNKKYIHLEDYMKPYGISEHDFEPWVIPKYGSFFNSLCCRKANFSTLDIGEYLGEILPADNTAQDELHIVAYKNIMRILPYKDKQETRTFDEYISQTNRTILDITNNFQIKKSIVIDTDFFIQKPLMFDPTSLVEIKKFRKSNSKPQKNIKNQKKEEPFQQSINSFKNKHKLKRRRNDTMRVEYLLN
ncbi:hypothetical protein BB559_003024 [Furculomyces boomerangus]|uniref:Transcription factor domain-containing protein n=1 Tax=Furculomyces boomerangus TaxID=61424 RepID=A0A2T9YQ37_9FUNG|nr:hypothetical protein BB559_003024 [Furculomyces boomerangus]